MFPRGRVAILATSGRICSKPFPRSAVASMPRTPTIEITYCRLCGWGLRASWMAQELLTTFAEELGSITLTPDVTGGVFEVRADNDLIWSREEKGRLPDIKELKRLVRDHVAPGRSLGHTDRT
jgi:selenoprotein W-related protein